MCFRIHWRTHLNRQYTPRCLRQQLLTEPITVLDRSALHQVTMWSMYTMKTNQAASIVRRLDLLYDFSGILFQLIFITSANTWTVRLVPVLE